MKWMMYRSAFPFRVVRIPRPENDRERFGLALEPREDCSRRDVDEPLLLDGVRHQCTGRHKIAAVAVVVPRSGAVAVIPRRSIERQHGLLDFGAKRGRQWHASRRPGRIVNDKPLGF